MVENDVIIYIYTMLIIYTMLSFLVEQLLGMASPVLTFVAELQVNSTWSLP